MNQRTTGKGVSPFQTIFQFADVARPVVGQHGFKGFVAEHFFLPGSSRHAFQEITDQQGNVLAALAQRGNAQAQNIETEIKIAAKLALRDGLFQIAIGGG